ncbi:MAG: site-specific integrase, partial [Alistipes sp.]|nr:site-specific integrase [Alistipes sp.]
MEIKLIKRKLKTGRTSLVLEYYSGYSLGENGTTKAKRKFETLEYFLHTNPKDKAERDHNKVNLEMAGKVKAKRLLAHQNTQYGFSVEYKIRTNLVEYIERLIDERKASPGNWGNWDSALKHFVTYAGTETTFEMVDKPFVEGFKKHLAKEAKTKSNTPLSASSQSSYFLKLKAALNQAVDDGIIPHSPASAVKPAKIEEAHREYLTFEELQRLLKARCKYPILKDAFIFSCLTGMRW